MQITQITSRTAGTFAAQMPFLQSSQNDDQDFLGQFFETIAGLVVQRLRRAVTCSDGSPGIYGPRGAMRRGCAVKRTDTRSGSGISAHTLTPSFSKR
jgi:hypothetical protein